MVFLFSFEVECFLPFFSTNELHPMDEFAITNLLCMHECSL